MDKRIHPKAKPKTKTFLSALSNRLPFMGAIVLTALITIWAGLMLNTLFTTPSRRTAPPLVTQQPLSTSATPAPPSTPVPPWLQQSTPLPSVPVTVTPGQPAPPAASQNPSAPAQITAANPSPSGAPLPQARYGHLPYQEADPSQLVVVGTYGTGGNQRSESLEQNAATAFENLRSAAAAAGVHIIPISGFRTIADQDKLFQRQISRQGSESAAAQLSAPPGYSEHHTGYAIDVGDGNQPTADLKFAFEETAVYRWIQQNGREFGFELSFPPNNAQGVSFEPWHWRYVGTNRAKAIFSVAHTLQNR
jgi:zinc D-Ala-D-Ala carboxypeptidase